MTILSCDHCGARVGAVRDTRFGLAPSGSRCRACSLPAFAPRVLPA